MGNYLGVHEYPHTLGFKISEIGTYSLRPGAAMAMTLDQIPVSLRMMIGRWSSDAFLKYTRKQVEQCRHNVAQRMIKNLMFRYIQEMEPQVSHLDLRQRNHPDNAETRRNVGGNDLGMGETLLSRVSRSKKIPFVANILSGHSKLGSQTS